MNRTLERQVWKRARATCEYCQMSQQHDDLPFQIDHIIAEQHSGETTLDNLALSCLPCNKYKGPNIAGIDSHTGKIAGLFHLRQHKWKRHFRWEGPVLLGRTSIGRATIAVLRINLSERIEVREALIREGVFPPQESPK